MCEMHYYRVRRTGEAGAANAKTPYGPALPKGERRKISVRESRKKEIANPPIARLMSKIEHDTNGGCWLWSAQSQTDFGYGLFKWAGKYLGAHRASWLMLVGPIPPGLSVCHKCDIPQCINPDHLFLGTQKANVQDAIAKGRWTQSVQAKKAETMFREKVGKTVRLTMTKKRRRECLERSGHVCAYPGCDETEGLEIDHIICLGLGGKDEAQNLEPLCGHHHRQKTDRDIRLIAKARRLSSETGQAARRAKNGPQIKSRGFQKGGPKRKIPSRPFR